MTPFRFHPDAEAEMIDAAIWYESQQEGLGKRFLTVIQDTLNKIRIILKSTRSSKAMFAGLLQRRFPTESCSESNPISSLSWLSCICTVTRTTGRVEISIHKMDLYHPVNGEDRRCDGVVL